jgi:signal transduction histidine kinase
MWPLEGGDLPATIANTGQPARLDGYDGVPGRAAAHSREKLGIRCSVGSPVVVEDELWGALFVHSTRSEPLPADTESRLENFTELVGTAIANAQARAEVHRLAEEQAALRRVATLVAGESPPEDVFAAVAEEVARLLGVEDARIERYEADGTVTVLADWGAPEVIIPVGTRRPLDGDAVSAVVQRTGRPARAGAAAVGSPIVVDGRLWGAITAVSRHPLPADTESRIGEFTELVATAISNFQVRSDLAESRARIAAAADLERRRLVRDLHDGAQQRLVHTLITLKLARQALQNRDETALELVTEALDHTQQTTAELRELAHGILPAALTHGGLYAGVDALASRMPVPVENEVSVGRLPAAIEATAYFVVAEALTNVAKHAHAGQAVVAARVESGTLRVQVRDDGVGGARPDGSGLVGLRDRLAVLDGRLRVESPAEGGTLVDAAIPLDAS